MLYLGKGTELQLLSKSQRPIKTKVFNSRKQSALSTGKRDVGFSLHTEDETSFFGPSLRVVKCFC